VFCFSFRPRVRKHRCLRDHIATLRDHNIFEHDRLGSPLTVYYVTSRHRRSLINGVVMVTETKNNATHCECHHSQRRQRQQVLAMQCYLRPIDPPQNGYRLVYVALHGLKGSAGKTLFLSKVQSLHGFIFSLSHCKDVVCSPIFH